VSDATPQAAKKSKGLSERGLKTLGVLFVILSGLGTAVVAKGMPADLGQADLTQLTVVIALEVVSWAAYPVYAWLLYWGFTHTRSVWRYGLRLFALAVLSEVPYDLATSGKVWDTSSQNPVFALVIGLVVLYFLDWLREHRPAGWAVVSVVVVAAGAFWLVMFNIGMRMGLVPGGLLIYAFTMIIWFLHARENTMMLVGGLLGALAFVLPAFGFVLIHFRNDVKLASPVERYAFYALYPVCLLILGLFGMFAVPA